MVTEGLLNLWAWLQVTVVGWFPPLPAEAAAIFGAAPGNVQDVVDGVSKLAPIIPFGVLTVCWNVLIVSILVSLGIEVVRIVASYLTFGGGAT